MNLAIQANKSPSKMMIVHYLTVIMTAYATLKILVFLIQIISERTIERMETKFNAGRNTNVTFTIISLKNTFKSCKTMAQSETQRYFS